MPQIWEYRYTVRGNGKFPIDMLRYSWSRPASSTDSNVIEQTLTERITVPVDITLVSISDPMRSSNDRYRSFGWEVLDVEKMKVAL